MIPYKIPFIGSLLDFGMRPLDFFMENYNKVSHCLEKLIQKYGDCFTFMMWGRNMTFVLGPDGNNFLFNVKLANASAEDAYKSLTVPVFGPEVVYDVENSVLMEQKKFVKDALNTKALSAYVGFIEQETRDYFAPRWEKAGQTDLFKCMAELTIMTAARCLLGREIRSQLDVRVADLYHDLDNGFQPINFLFEWLPLPAYYKRDAANLEMRKIFLGILQDRKKNGFRSDDYDLMETLSNARYRDGSPMSETAVCCLMIGVLMAGQHTSSTTGTWLMLFLAERPEIRKELMKEQARVLTGNPDTPPSEWPPLTYDALKQLNLLDACIKETLRVRPPIIVHMRKVLKDVEYKGMIIPEGNYLCGSPAVSALDETVYPNATEWDPYRFFSKETGDVTNSGPGEWAYEKFDAAEKSARSNYLPFGAGRHRCIGESFAYVQLKTIASTLLRMYDFELPLDAQGNPKMPQRDFTSMIVMVCFTNGKINPFLANQALHHQLHSSLINRHCIITLLLIHVACHFRNPRNPR